MIRRQTVYVVLARDASILSHGRANEVVCLSLLKKRARALVYGFAAGEAPGFGNGERMERGELTLTALGLARAVARVGGVDEPELRKASLEGNLPIPFGEGETQDGDVIVGAVRALAAGIVRRPQDYNGLVDDVVSIVAVHRYTAPAVASGCAVAATIAALLDGWDMESAGSLAVAIAKRGATFGRKTGEPFVHRAIREAMMRVDDFTVGRSANLRRALDALRPLAPLPRALGIAYACRDAQRAVEAAGADPLHARFVGAIAGGLSAAHHPDSLPKSWVDAAASAIRAKGLDPDRLVDDLLDLRMRKWAPVF